MNENQNEAYKPERRLFCPGVLCGCFCHVLITHPICSLRNGKSQPQSTGATNWERWRKRVGSNPNSRRNESQGSGMVEPKVRRRQSQDPL